MKHNWIYTLHYPKRYGDNRPYTGRISTATYLNARSQIIAMHPKAIIVGISKG